MSVKKINILIAEDNEHDFKKTKRSLQKCSFPVNITRCIRGEEVLELLSKLDDKTSIDILLTDYMMPGMTGLELAEILLNQDVPFPIILLTGEGDENIAVKALKLGVFDYLAKDVDSIIVELLPTSIEKALQSYANQHALKELESKNKKLSSALEQSQSAILITDLNKNIIYMNVRYEEISGYSQQEIIGQNISQLTFSKSFTKSELNAMWKSVLSGKKVQRDLKKHPQNSDAYWASLSMTGIKENDEFSFILIVEDRIDERSRLRYLEKGIKKQKKAEVQLVKSKEKEKEVSKALAMKIQELNFQKGALDEHAIVSIADIQGKIIHANQKFSDISQFSHAELIAENHRVVKSGLHPASFYKNMWRTISMGEIWHGEVQNKAKDNSLYWVSSTIVPMLDEQGKPKQYISIQTDITASKEQQKNLELMAHFDLLTGLPNRILLTDRFEQAVIRSNRTNTFLGVCFLDLDNFKPVNDLYGHDVGDKLLVEVSERIKVTIRADDTASRQGGDEFIILLGNVSSVTEFKPLLNRLIEAISQPYFHNEHKLIIGASIGYSIYPIDNVDIDTLVRHADHAMYAAKLAGRNTFSLFDPDDDKKNIEQHSHIQLINDSFVNNEFCLFYQPKVNMRTGIVFGAEALIRWQHAEDGIISPLDFLPKIEGSNLEVEIGDWVIEQALLQMSYWRTQGHTLEVSVNISSHHLQSDRFVMKLKETLDKYPDFDPQYLQLEILENSALGDVNKVSSIIKTCQDLLGVKIALDDFGTGYSSLTHLKNLTANTIKIDRSFVRDIIDDPNDNAIIEGVIGLANAFDREIIAEGVENTEDGIMLLIMGCEEAQGFHIAKPMPAANMQKWLSEYTANKQWVQIGSQSFTQQEKSKLFFSLVLNRWVDRIESNIQSSPENLRQWPILISDKTPCSVWIQKEKNGHEFEPSWLNHLEELNIQLISLANDILQNYQLGQFDLAIDSLTKLRSISDAINKLVVI